MSNHSRWHDVSLAALGAFGVLAIVPASGLAGQVVPDVAVRIQASDGTDVKFNPDGTATGGVVNYVGGVVFDGFTFDWDFDAADTLHDGAFIENGFEISSTTLETITFAISVTLPMTAGGTDLPYDGSVSFTLSGIDGLLAAPAAGLSMWEGYADGVEVVSSFDYPSAMWFTGESVATSFDTIPPGELTDAAKTIGIKLNVSLSPMDTVRSTGVFGVAPGAAPCTADVDGSGSVDLVDFLAVVAAWGPCSSCAEDLDKDGSVGFTDLLLVMSYWDSCV